MEHVTFEPGPPAFEGIEVSGLAVQAFFRGLDAAEALVAPLLIAEGIGQPAAGGKVFIEPLAWYPLAGCLRVLRAISRTLGAAVLFQLGTETGLAQALPPSARDVHDAVRTLDASYHASFRRDGQSMLEPGSGQVFEGIGHYGYERLDDRRILSEVSSPFPCAFDRGLLTARCRRLESNAWVFHDDTRPCRDDGAGACAYQVTWL